MDWAPPARAQAPGSLAYKSWLDQIRKPGGGIVDFDVQQQQPPIVEPAHGADAGVQELALDRPKEGLTQANAPPVPQGRARNLV